jgi:crotonobetainyl-CoA:carnitine CoA-transferase CaiB-like acyl-CoA transferase
MALENLRVLDLSSEVAGPYCARLFGDYGADVIKVEPTGGERGRDLEPFFPMISSSERSAFFTFLNFNKRGIVLDLQSESGRDVFLRLLGEADVVVESFRPGYLESLGLGFEALEARKPGIILTSITPYGQTPPWSEREGNDLTAFAMGLWADANQVDGMPPLKGAGYSASFVAGIAAYVATLAAVLGRGESGIGNHVDVSIVEAIAALMAPMFYGAQTQGARRRGAGGERLTRVKDGYMSLTLGLTRFLDQAWIELGLPDVEEGRALWEHGDRAELMQKVAEAAAAREKYDLFLSLTELQCPAGMALTTADLFSDPHLRQRGFWVEVDQPGAGKIEMPGPSFQLSQTPFTVRRPSPAVGQHTDEVLSGLLGLSEGEVQQLRRGGAIA